MSLFGFSIDRLIDFLFFICDGKDDANRYMERENFD